MEGYIYIITNKSFPGWVKIGVTEDIKSRLRTYQTSSPLRNYKIEYYIHHPDCYGAEKDINKTQIHISGINDSISTDYLYRCICSRHRSYFFNI